MRFIAGQGRGRALLLLMTVTGVAVLAGTVGALAADRFGDVAAGHPHENGIGWVADAGVTAGCRDGSDYCPDHDVSRDQMATFLHRLSGHAPGVSPSVDAATVQGMTPEDLRGQTGPQGPEGETGPAGPEGQEGPAGPAGGVGVPLVLSGPGTTFGMCEDEQWHPFASSCDPRPIELSSVALRGDHFPDDTAARVEAVVVLDPGEGGCIRLRRLSDGLSSDAECATNTGDDFDFFVLNAGPLPLTDGEDRYVVESRATDDASWGGAGTTKVTMTLTND